MISALRSFFGDKPRLPPVQASLFARAEGYSVASLDLDLILSESHALTAQVSEHPVEDGSVISTHIRNNLRMGSLRALISNHSLRYAPAASDTTELSDVIEQSRTTVLENAAALAWRDLKALHEAREPVTIVTVLEVYRDVVITSIQTTMDDTTGEALEFEVTFQQIRKVKLRTTSLTAAVQSESMGTDLERRTAVRLNAGQKVGQSSFTMNAVLVNLGA